MIRYTILTIVILIVLVLTACAATQARHERDEWAGPFGFHRTRTTTSYSSARTLWERETHGLRVSLPDVGEVSIDGVKERGQSEALRDIYEQGFRAGLNAATSR